MHAVSDLRLLLVSRHTLIVARMDDEQRFMSVLRRAADLCGVPVWTWSVTRGLVRDGHSMRQTDTRDLKSALVTLLQHDSPAVFVLHDVRSMLQDAVVVRSLKEFAMHARPGQTVVLTGPDASVPPELDGLALPWTLEPPEHAEIVELVERTLGSLIERDLAVALDDAGVQALATAASGLTLPEIERLIVREAVADGTLDVADVEHVRAAKAELLAEDGVLSLVPSDVDLSQVGGLEALKRWLALRGRGFEPEAKGFGVDPPRGLLLTGVPGCGKSLVAKTVARSWGMPLVLLDPGAIYGSYVGQSEERLRSALATVEAMTPIVLWIDEVEKGFAAGDGTTDAGVSRRVLGAFLRWLQDRPDGIFLVATCNDVTHLPPELLRRGRFDEVFFVDLPSGEERSQIVALHLRRRGRDPGMFDLPSLVGTTEGFTGAELEGVVVGGLYRAYAAGEELGSAHLLAEAAETVPLSRTRAEEVDRLRAWAAGRAVPASGQPADPTPAPPSPPPSPGYA